MDAGPDAVVVTCTEPTGGPTMHESTLFADETWSAEAGPHQVTFDIAVSEGATLTIEPCAEVLIAAGRSITVSGALEAPGTPSEPIRIGALDAEPWATIQSYGGMLNLSSTTIEGGGDPGGVDPSLVAMLDVRGDQTMPTQELLHVDHVTLRDSASLGLRLVEGGGCSATSDGLTITGSAEAPIEIWPRAVGTIPPGTYTGNGDDQIRIPGNGGSAAILEDTTMHARGVPYHIGTSGTFGDLVIGSAPGMPPATLTVEAGVTVRFKKDGVMSVEPYSGTDPASGALVAVGTASEPIVFTSAQASPLAGDWLGIYFGSTPDPASRMDYTEVRYAGGLSGTGSFSCTHTVSDGRSEAAIRIVGGAPAQAFVTHTLIADSAGYGIDRGWTGDPIDFVPTNTFANLAWCPQTAPIPPAVGCTGVTIDCP
jgi:hypothetical protein